MPSDIFLVPGDLMQQEEISIKSKIFGFYWVIFSSIVSIRRWELTNSIGHNSLKKRQNIRHF